MTSLSHWNDAETQDDSWDTLILGGEFAPGIPVVSCRVKRDMDEKKSPGSDGAELEDKGYSPAEVTIDLQIYHPEELQALPGFLAKIHPRRKGGPRDPVQIIYPAVNALGVTAVYIKDIHSKTPDSKRGLTVTIRAVEWFPAPKKVKKGAGKPGKTGQKTTAKGFDSIDRFGGEHYAEEFQPDQDGSAQTNLF